MAREYSRAKRVADHIQKQLARTVQTDMHDPRLAFVTVNYVNVSRDFAFADVYVSFLSKDEQTDIDRAVAVLNHAAGFLRSRLAHTTQLRTTPKLRFHYDNSVRRGHYLSALIEQAVAQQSS